MFRIQLQKKVDIVKAKSLTILVIAASLIYFPILFTPIAADDMWLSLIPQYFGEGGYGWLEWINNQWKFWEPRGRFFFIGILYGSIWPFVFETRIQLKVFYMIANISFVIFLYYFMYHLLKSRKIAGSAILVFLSVSQLLGGYDPRSQFYGIIFLSCIVSLVAIYQIVNIKKDFNLVMYFKYLLMLIIGALTYELSILSLPLIIITSYLIKRKYLKNHLFYLLTTVTTIVTILSIKLSAPVQDNYNASFELRRFLNAYKVAIYETVTYGPLANIIIIFFVCCILYTFGKFFYNQKYKIEKQESMMFQSTYMAGLFFVAFLAVPIPSLLTEKYANPIIDSPYIHILQQQVFFSLTAGILMYSISNTIIRYISYVLIFSQLLLTFFHNLEFRTVNSFTKNNLGDPSIFGFQRDLTESALKNQVFEKILLETGVNRIWAGDLKPWLTQNYIINNKTTGTLLNSSVWWGNSNSVPSVMCDINNSDPVSRDCTRSSDLIFYLVSNSYSNGFIIFHLNEFEKTSQNERYIIYFRKLQDQKVIDKCANIIRGSTLKDSFNLDNITQFETKVEIESLKDCISASS